MPVGNSGGRSGHGTTIALGTSGFTASIRRIEGLERLREWLETSHLGLALNAERTRVPADLIDCSPFVVVFEFNPSFTTQPPIAAAAETITITFPLRTGETSAATLVLTGGLSRDKGPDIEVNPSDVMLGEITIQPDGLTGPTYTAGS